MSQGKPPNYHTVTPHFSEDGRSTGRFANMQRQLSAGEVPRQPPNSPWACDPLGPEAPFPVDISKAPDLKSGPAPAPPFSVEPTDEGAGPSSSSRSSSPDEVADPNAKDRPQ